MRQCVVMVDTIIIFALYLLQLCRRASLEDLEHVSCQLAPTVQHRIIAAQGEEHIQELIRKRETTDNTTVIAEVDENNT